MNNYNLDFDKYKHILTKELKESYIALTIFAVVCLVSIFLLVLWEISIIKDKNNIDKMKDGNIKSKKKKYSLLKENKRDKILWITVTIFACVITTIATVNQIRYINDLKYEIDNEVYEVIDSEFEIIREEGGSYREGRFSLIYKILTDNSNELILYPEHWSDDHILSGKYNNSVLVYSSRTKIVLDLIHKSS
ncbi:MAG: hypothetical protein E7652_03500 [Ruminococcaceae bacterium]|nr:hypothetical protein [Oscillospiraceae bacterium]